MASKINGNTNIPKINSNRISTLKINGNTVWNAERIRVPALPFTSSERTIGDAVVFNNEIHFVGGPWYETKHYKFNGTSWVKIADFPTNYPGIRLAECTESNDSKSIHAIIPTDIHTLKHYKFNGTSWTELDPPPSNCDYIAYRDYYGIDNPVILFSNGTKLYCFVLKQNNDYYSGIQDYVFIYDTTTNTWDNNPIITAPFEGSRGLKYDNKIYIITNGRSSDSSKNLAAKISFSDLERDNNLEYYDFEQIPKNIYNAAVVVFNGNIHILGGGYYAQTQSGKVLQSQVNHIYRNSQGVWNLLPDIPLNFCGGGAVAWMGEIYLLGGFSNYVQQWDGDTWLTNSQ